MLKKPYKINGFTFLIGTLKMKKFYLPLLFATVSVKVYGMENGKLGCTTLPKSDPITIPVSKIPKIVVGYAMQPEQQVAEQEQTPQNDYSGLYYAHPGHSPVFNYTHSGSLELNIKYFQESDSSGSC